MKNIIVISAPSGAGKTTLCNELQRRKPHIKFSVSCTTRLKRKHEIDGVNYHFLSDQEFTEKVQNNEFVEYENVHGYYYGTLRKTLEDALAQQEMVLFDVDVNGAMAIKRNYSDNTCTIFILPPSLDDLKKRLIQRGSETEERIDKRLERTAQEMEYKDKFDACIINDDLAIAAEELNELITKQNEGVVYGS
jgi:guanylate kinase